MLRGNNKALEYINAAHAQAVTLRDMTLTPPLSLYIHIPWCVRKCPYCDFNSHRAEADLPERGYIAALLDGVAYEDGFVHTHTLVMNSSTRTVREVRMKRPV